MAATSSAPRHLASLSQYSASELKSLVALAASIKRRVKNNDVANGWRPLIGKNIAMIFEKRSTRTRVSSEAGVAMLGGHAMFLSAQDIHLHVNEPIRDTAAVLGRLSDVILARVNKHSTIDDLIRWSGKPVINALSEKCHPLQALADILTLKECFDAPGASDDCFKSLAGKTVAWVGDGNNVVHSLIAALPKFNVRLKIATPKGYEPDPEIISRAGAGDLLQLTSDPVEAVTDADAVVTDTWVSMGDEAQREERLRQFAGFQITRDLCRVAKNDWIFLHCMPRHAEEVEDAVFYDEARSMVLLEAENRMYTLMAVILRLLGIE